MKKYHRVIFLPENKTILVEDKKTIFETIKHENPQGIELQFACGAEGVCQKCKVRFFRQMGPLTPTEKGCLSDEELARGIRLSCQARIIQDTQAEIIYKKPFSIRLVDEPICAYVNMNINPRVEKFFISPAAAQPCIENVITLIAKRKGVATSSLRICDTACKNIVDFLKQGILCYTCVLIEDEIVAIEDGDTSNEKFGAAVDLGINTLMVCIVDLNAGKNIAVAFDTNPQMDISPDIALRMSMAVTDPVSMEILNEELQLRIDVLLSELCRAGNICSEHIYEIVLSGSGGMINAVEKGLSDQAEPVSKGNKCKVFSAHAASIRSTPKAKIRILPAVSPHIGADVVAGILVTGMHLSSNSTVLFLDIGTTLKAVLCHKGELFTLSTTGGDAFEGIGINFGMRPGFGAIESVKINNDIRVKTIGESLPRGICGSGLIELTSELIAAGVLNTHGDLIDPKSEQIKAPLVLERIISLEKEKAFLLYADDGEFQSDVYVTQGDFYALRSSKAYACAVIEVLLLRAGVCFKQIEKIFISGAFGYTVSADSLSGIGLVPAFSKEKTLFIGNASAIGAQMNLLDRMTIKRAEKIAKDIVYFDSGNDVVFENLLKKFSNFLPNF